jgi:hypothetical protein
VLPAAGLGLAAERPNLRTGCPAAPTVGEVRRSTQLSEQKDTVEHDYFRQLRDHAIAQCEIHETLYREENNPIFAWNALSFWVQGQILTTKSDTDIPEGHLRSPAFDMPHWLVIFLIRMLGNVQAMALFGLHPNPEIEDEVSPRQCISLVAEALEFKRDGFNAFVDYDKHRMSNDLSSLFAEAREAGKNYDEAMRLVMERYGTTDERTARRAMRGDRRPGQK